MQCCYTHSRTQDQMVCNVCGSCRHHWLFFCDHSALWFSLHQAGGAKPFPHFMEKNVSFLWFPVCADCCRDAHTHTHSWTIKTHFLENRNKLSCVTSVQALVNKWDDTFFPNLWMSEASLLHICCQISICSFNLFSPALVFQGHRSFSTVVSIAFCRPLNIEAATWRKETAI